MLDRVARLPGAPCLLTRGTRLGRIIAFYHVNRPLEIFQSKQSNYRHKQMKKKDELSLVELQGILLACCNITVSGLSILWKVEG